MYEQNMYIHDQFSILILKKKGGKRFVLLRVKFRQAQKENEENIFKKCLLIPHVWMYNAWVSDFIYSLITPTLAFRISNMG